MAAAQKEIQYKETIRKYLNYVLDDFLLPELPFLGSGKVRELYTSGQDILMVASDRVSAFDHVLPTLIPFKGSVLNGITKWAFRTTADVVPSALREGSSLDPNVLVQKRMKPIQVEFIVRGYLWGSMAAAYENGAKQFCGLQLPEGLIRFQKLPEPLFTPTTKAPVGKHDENITFDDVKSMLGEGVANLAKETALKLFERGTALFAEKGIILLDTKYEFGMDENNVLHVIDEVNTPDSSRLCDATEWETKFPKVETMMKSQLFSSVSHLMQSHPHLKVKEMSKQYLRDILQEKGYVDGSTPPVLTPDEVVECSYRYINVYERITGETFAFPVDNMSPCRRVIASLTASKLIKGCCVVILCGSDSDLQHVLNIEMALDSLGIPSQCRICSAHKQPRKLDEVLQVYNRSAEPLLLVAVAGGTDALSGTASFHSFFPVVSCPPDGLNNSCLTNPPGSPNAFVLRPDNVALFAAQMFTSANSDLREKLRKLRSDKVKALEVADEKEVKK